MLPEKITKIQSSGTQQLAKIPWKRSDHGSTLRLFRTSHELALAFDSSQPLSSALSCSTLIPVAPNLNAIAERWVQTLRQECPDHFVVFGEDHLRHICREYETHNNEERPHQVLGNVPLSNDEASIDGEVVCSERLGGLLKHYHRKAA